jgi:Xaa-Pro aminopeptidase
MKLSLQERDRRYVAIRNEMEKEEMDVLVIMSEPSLFGRDSVRYVSDVAVMVSGQYCIFPLEGDPILLVMRNKSDHNNNRWIKDIHYVGEKLTDLVQKFSKGNKVGLVSDGDGMNHTDYDALMKSYPGKVVSADNFYRNLRMVKSAEEIAMLRESTAIAEKIYNHVKENMVYSGVTDYEIIGAAQKICGDNGCDDNFLLLDAYENRIGLSLPVGNTLSKNGTLLLEISPGYQGYRSQVVVTLPVGGTYSASIEKLLPIWEEAYNTGVEKLKPGNRACDVCFAIREKLRKYELEPTELYGTGYGHGLFDGGLTLAADDTTELKPNMTIVLHPKIIADKPGNGIFMGFSYLLTENGAERLDKINLKDFANVNIRQS